MTALQNARVIVVGASGVLGGHIAAECHLRGARVMGVAHKGAAIQPGVSFVVADITNREGRAAITDAIRALGGVDVVILAAGVVGFGVHDTVSADHIESLIQVDLVAQLQLVAEVSPLMAEGGNITFITGAVVDVATLGTSTYTAAKAGLSAAAAVIRREMRTRQITVTDARPPHTETGLSSRAVFGTAPTLKQGLTPQVVARRIVDAIENNEVEIPPTSFSTE